MLCAMSKPSGKSKARKSKALPVPGFRAAGIRCGIKRVGPDLALVASDVPASVAGVLTRSTVPGAPVR